MKKRSSQKSNKVHSSTSASSRSQGRATDSSRGGSHSNQTRSRDRGFEPPTPERQRPSSQYREWDEKRPQERGAYGRSHDEERSFEPENYGRNSSDRMSSGRDESYQRWGGRDPYESRNQGDWRGPQSDDRDTGWNRNQSHEDEDRFESRRQSSSRGSQPSEDENRYRARTTEGRDYGYDADESGYMEEDYLTSDRYQQPTQGRSSSARRDSSYRR